MGWGTIDQTLIAVFDTMGIEGKDLILHADDTYNFANDINGRAAASKFAMSIGSVSAYNNGTSDLFELTLTHINDLTATIDSIQASKPQKLTPEIISKIWHIKLDQQKKVLNQTIQLYRQVDITIYLKNSLQMIEC